MLEDSISILKGNVRLASNLWTWNVGIYVYIYIYIYISYIIGVDKALIMWDNNILRVCPYLPGGSGILLQ